MTNDLHHVSKGQRQRMKTMSDADQRRHYLFLWAASKNCTECVQYWLANGADVHRGQVSDASATALRWATESGAHEAADMLRAVTQTPVSEPVRKIPRVSESGRELACSEDDVTEVEEPEQGIWADEDYETSLLRRYFENVSHRRLWRAVMKGDVGQVYLMVFLQGLEIWIYPDAKELPPRMFYWSLLEFVRFAIAFWQPDEDRKEKLLTVRNLLEEAELQRFCEVVRFYTDFPHMDVSQRWAEWKQGVLTPVSDDVEVDFWSAFGPHSTEEAAAPFLHDESWIAYDPFATALDLGIAAPEYCGHWKLRHWTQAMEGKLETIQQMESDLIEVNVSGWNCWTTAQKQLVAQLLCECEDVCAECRRDD